MIDPVMGFDARSGRRDPAPVQQVADAITQGSLQLQWVLETHAHADHLSGGPWLQQRLGGQLAGSTCERRDGSRRPSPPRT